MEPRDSKAPVTLINTFVVAEGEEEEFVKRWDRHAKALVDQPGFIDTKLHRSLDAHAAYTFVNVARWQSLETFKAAISRPEYQQLGRLTHYQSTPGLYEVAVTY